MEELLLESVRKHTILYDIKSPNYVDIKMRQEVWEEVGRELNISPEIAKEKWTKLRRCFWNAVNRRRSKKSGEASKKILPWKYEQQMTFLLPFLESRTTQSNIEQQTECENNLNQEKNNGGIEQEKEQDEQESSENADQYNNIEENSDCEVQNETREMPGKMKHSKRPKSASHNTAHEMISIMRENAKLRRANYENKSLESSANCFTDLDETDMFFLSMSRMTKQLPKLEQTQIKLTLSNTVLNAEMRNNEKESSVSFE